VKFHFLFATAVLASVVSPLAAQAQGVPGGIAYGAYEGNRRAGPLGAVVGGAVGGVVGGVEGVLGIGYRPYAAAPPRVYYHRTRVKHSYRQVRRKHRIG
jgi:hypothetical protein